LFWSDLGSAIIGIDSTDLSPSGSSAPDPSVTSNWIAAGPTNSGVDRNCRVVSSLTGGVPSLPAVTCTRSANVSFGLCPERTRT